MSMTREEAIEILRKRQRYCKVIADHANETVKVDELREVDAIDMAITALRPVSREQVEMVWRGEWIHDPDTGYEYCDKCAHTIFLDDYLNRKSPLFCEMCGDAKTDEAVEMVMERLEALHEITE